MAGENVKLEHKSNPQHTWRNQGWRMKENKEMEECSKQEMETTEGSGQKKKSRKTLTNGSGIPTLSVATPPGREWTIRPAQPEELQYIALLRC